MASAPESLTLKENRDEIGRGALPWIRRGLLALLAVLLLAALANVFGQRPTQSNASGPRAELHVYAPLHARSGVVYAARFRVDAHAEIKKAMLVLWPGWAEGYTVNGLAPQPVAEASDNGKLSFDVGHIPAGRHFTFWISLQVNPTNIGHRKQRVELYDGSERLASVDRTITIFP